MHASKVYSTKCEIEDIQAMLSKKQNKIAALKRYLELSEYRIDWGLIDRRQVVSYIKTQIAQERGGKPCGIK